jgi:hypothetical protein
MPELEKPEETVADLSTESWFAVPSVIQASPA